MTAFKAKQAAALKPKMPVTEILDDEGNPLPAEQPDTQPANDPLTLLQSQDAALLKQFPSAISARLLPWTFSGSAGLKNQGIHLRNNIEIHLFANAGEDESEGPQVYKVDNQWLISVAYPVKSADEVHGVLLLTYPLDMAKNLFNQPFVTDFSRVQLVRTPRNNVLFSVGGGIGEATEHYSSPIKDTELTVTSRAPNPAALKTSYTLVYGIIIALAVFAAIVVFVVYGLINKAIGDDALVVKQFLSRLAGLHKPEKPAISFKSLQDVLNEADKLSDKIAKNALTANGKSKVAADLSQAQTNSNKQSVAFSDVADMAVVEEVDDTPSRPEFLHLFRDYDIRGNADSIDDTLATDIGRALATEAQARGQKTIAVAGDCRLSTPRLKAALISGLTQAGCDVVDVGTVPSPILYFATHHLNTQAGIMITGSHNEKDHNGFKMILGGQSLHGDEIRALADRIIAGDFASGDGQVSEMDLEQPYMDEICTDVIAANPMKIVVDGGNGTGGEIASQILQQLDCEVVPLYCEMDGNFPNHSPDPCNAENLQDLIQAVRDNGADMGIALDGDADRMVAVTHDGEIIAGDQLMMIFAADVVSRNPASTVVYDIKCSRYLGKVITENGGRPVLWKTGHSNIKAKMRETDALLGGEYTGHYCFKERWYGFDDGIYSAMRLIELLTMEDRSLAERVSALPHVINTPEMVIDLDNDDEKFAIMEQLTSAMAQTDGNLIDIDGIRIEFADGWGLVRASNTGARLTARFEGDSPEALARIQEVFSQAMAGINPKLALM